MVSSSPVPAEVRFSRIPSPARCGVFPFLRLSLLLFLFFAAIALLPAAAESVASVLNASGYSGSQRQAIESAVHRLETAGVPGSLLLPRLAEGIARGVAPGRLLKVLDRNGTLLLRARAILQSTPDGRSLLSDRSAWSLTATLLAAGGKTADIERLAQASGANSASYRASALLYGSLERWGLDAQQSLGVSIAALHSDLPSRQYSSISAIFVQGRAMSIPPSRLVARVLHALPKVHSYEELKRRVLY